ncbi:MAG: hypothetical protein RDV48_23825 [Candidatus Eremiobacteraeota bacterium]|nr:hypothetical protein [Candidatus Eremiobacteraeota bacterium]
MANETKILENSDGPVLCSNRCPWSRESLRHSEKVSRFMMRLLIVAFIIQVIVQYLPGQSYIPVYRNACLDCYSLNAAREVLKESRIDFIVNDEGTMVRVPPAKLKQARSLLASQGIEKRIVRQGYYVLQQAASPREERILTLERDLEESIECVEGIERVSVKIDLPARPWDQIICGPSAVVMLICREGCTLSSNKVRGIIHLVAYSVEDMKPENVKIVNAEGCDLMFPSGCRAVSGSSCVAAIKIPHQDSAASLKSSQGALPGVASPSGEEASSENSSGNYRNIKIAGKADLKTGLIFLKTSYETWSKDRPAIERKLLLGLFLLVSVVFSYWLGRRGSLSRNGASHDFERS